MIHFFQFIFELAVYSGVLIVLFVYLPFAYGAESTNMDEWSPTRRENYLAVCCFLVLTILIALGIIWAEHGATF